MASRMTPVEAAKQLGVRPQVIYGLIKHNRVRTFPNPTGKAPHVDFGEVQAVTKSIKPHRPKGSDGKPIRRRAGVQVGTLVSSHVRFQAERKDRPHRVYAVSEVHSNEDGEFVWTQNGEGREAMFYETEKLADLVRAGKCHIEEPGNLLGLLMFHWVHNEAPELAAALQMWCEVNGVEFTELQAAEGVTVS